MVRVAFASCVALALCAVPAMAQTSGSRTPGARTLGTGTLGAKTPGAETLGAHATALSAQTRRPPARVRVYPGRLLYRDCDFRLVQQWRPSGPVIVPWQHCWWVRG